MCIVSDPRSRIKPQGFYVPETFDAPAVVGNKLADHANYLVSLIRWKQIQWQGDEDGWVPLNATVLCDNLTPRHYYKVRQALVDHHYCSDG